MKRIVISLAMLAIASGATQARVCIVSNLDTSGCQLGDELLYLPRSDGNEQLPLEFVAKKCDMNKTVAWTNSGVACIYAGDKEMVNGHTKANAKPTQRFMSLRAAFFPPGHKWITGPIGKSEKTAKAMWSSLANVSN